MEPVDDPLAAQFATFREDTLGIIRPAGAADARRLYEQRHRARVLTVAVAAVAVAIIMAGGGFALADRSAGTLPADRRSASPSQSDIPTSAGPSAPSVAEPGAISSGTPSGTASAPAGVRVTSVTAIGVNTLWAVGYAPCDGHAWSTCPSVLSSHDAGHSWTAVAAPGTAPYVGEIRFANNKDGWVVAQAGINDGTNDPAPTGGWGVLYATHDGGGSWQKVTSVHAVTQVEAAAGQVWAMDEGNTLFTAPVGSNTFTEVIGVGTDSETDATVVHGKQAYAYPTRWGANSYGTPWVVVAHADGTTTKKALPCAEIDTFDIALAAPADATLEVVCGAVPDANGQNKTAFSSIDGGTTWTALGSPDHAGMITSVASSAAGTFLAGTGMPLRATRDNGTTWPVVLAAPAEGGFRYVGFTDDKHGFALGGAAPPPTGGVRADGVQAGGTREIRMTSDGGHTWSTFDFS